MRYFKDGRVIVFLAALAISLSAGVLCYAQVEFRFVCEEGERGCKPYVSQDDGKKVPLEQTVVLSTGDIEKAVAQSADRTGASGEPLAQVLLVFTPEGKYKLEEVTTRKLRHRLGVVIDRVLMTAPKIHEPFVDGEVVVGGPNMDRSKALALAASVNQAIETNKNRQWVRGAMK